MSYENRGYRPRQEGGNRYRGGGPNRYRDNRRNFNGGGYQRRPYDRPPPPESKEDDLEDIEIRLKGLIIKIGDKFTSDLQVNLTKMKNILDNDYHKYPTTVQDTLTACVTELPAKAPVYGALLGLLNVSSHEIVAKLMTEFNKTMEEAFAQSNWFRLKQMFRFYGELVNANVILPGMYCTLIQDALSGLDQPNQSRQRLDCLAYIVLSALPWCGKELTSRCATELDQILKKIEIYMQRRGSLPKMDLLDQFQHASYNPPHQDLVAHLWTLTQELKAKSWDLPLIPKPYSWFDKEFASALQHDLPRFNLAPHQDNITYIAPTPIMRLWVDKQGKSTAKIPSYDSIEYFIIQETITDTLYLFEANRKDCARYLLNIFTSYNPKLFKSIAPNEEDKDDKWNIPSILLESVFSHLLHLPSAPHRQVFYSCVLIELCRAESATFPMTLGRSVKELFNRLETMDVECIARLWSWFSHHLSNFGFQWDWETWSSILELDPNHPQVCFVRETFEKVTRLSYYERIKSILPTPFHALIPTFAPAPNFAFKDVQDPLHPKAKHLIENLRTKKTTDEIRAILDGYKEELVDEDDAGQQQKVRFMFVQCLLLVGSKSFSHILNVVERYLDILRMINSTPEARLHTVHIVASFWKNNTQFLGILLDKLLNYRIIDPTSVITWAFEIDQSESAGRAYVWEILKNTLNKVNSRVVQVKGKLDALQSLHDTNKQLRATAETNEMTEAEEQQELDTIRIAENSLASVSREQKEVFMVVYQKFVGVLKEQKPNEASWTYKWILGWLKEMLRVHHKECGGFMTTLETLIFTPDVDEKVNAVFNQAKLYKQEMEMII
ncbi:Nuclear cap-binding protein subunit 1 [Choanephora cucurbitarum]|uniref:Nuclear cap-binding protein subunit 1 n=1 Tax=Choanephora cucurbitarum TaxID=101091 RepID=A0A1C7NQ92_9FUNG|nr:Nuclear cap-binding protein subunit 1 [Choanephora cucurbitarum]